tara:strand:- start:925 stop:1218 length:294 start_codon:yes stop_codon:yes gene_type:complete
MSYGIEISTTSLTKNIADSSPCRVMGLVEARTASGSQVVQGYDTNKGFIYINNLHSNYYWVPVFTFDNSTKVFTWTKNPYIDSANDNVDFYFIMQED